MKRTILAAVLLAGAALTTPASADTVMNGFFTSDHCDVAAAVPASPVVSLPYR